MDDNTLSLWCAYPDNLLSDEIAQLCAALLSEDERARLGAFRSGEDRREFLAAHALVRVALSRANPLAPETWRFDIGPYGKPRIAAECDLRFSLSRSERLVACLVSDGIEVGIDLEPHGRAEAIAEIAVRVFSPAELAQYEALTGVEKLERALSLWTLKEAYAKARGLGLSLPLEKISFLFGGEEGIRLELDSEIGDDSGRWQFCLLEHAGHRIAVVTERIPALRLQFCEARQVLAEPKRLGSAGVRWFANPAKAR